MRKLLKNKIVQALIIDDEIDMCYLLKKILKNKNIESSHVGSIYEAKLHLNTSMPALIFLDNHLPDGLGVEFIKDIKNTHPEVKIIFISGHDTIFFKDMAIGAGALCFIGKPFTAECINSTLDSLRWD